MNGTWQTVRVVAVIGAVLAPVAGPAQTLDLERLEEVADSMAHDQIATGRAPSVSVAVARNGEVVLARGYGRADVELEGHRKIAHGGGINGFSAYLSHYPDAGLTIAVLTNAGSGQPGRVEELLARTALGMDLVAVKDLPVTAAEMARYEGTYRLQVGPGTLDLRVFGRDGRLMSAPGRRGVPRRQ